MIMTKDIFMIPGNKVLGHLKNIIQNIQINRKDINRIYKNKRDSFWN